MPLSHSQTGRDTSSAPGPTSAQWQSDSLLDDVGGPPSVPSPPFAPRRHADDFNARHASHAQPPHSQYQPAPDEEDANDEPTSSLSDDLLALRVEASERAAEMAALEAALEEEHAQRLACEQQLAQLIAERERDAADADFNARESSPSSLSSASETASLVRDLAASRAAADELAAHVLALEREVSEGVSAQQELLSAHASYASDARAQLEARDARHAEESAAQAARYDELGASIARSLAEVQRRYDDTNRALRDLLATEQAKTHRAEVTFARRVASLQADFEEQLTARTREQEIEATTSTVTNGSTRTHASNVRDLLDAAELRHAAAMASQAQRLERERAEAADQHAEEMAQLKARLSESLARTNATPHTRSAQAESQTGVPNTETRETLHARVRSAEAQIADLTAALDAVARAHVASEAAATSPTPPTGLSPSRPLTTSPPLRAATPSLVIGSDSDSSAAAAAATAAILRENDDLRAKVERLQVQLSTALVEREMPAFDAPSARRKEGRGEDEEETQPPPPPPPHSDTPTVDENARGASSKPITVTAAVGDGDDDDDDADTDANDAALQADLDRNALARAQEEVARLRAQVTSLEASRARRRAREAKAASQLAELGGKYAVLVSDFEASLSRAEQSDAEYRSAIADLQRQYEEEVDRVRAEAAAEVAQAVTDAKAALEQRSTTSNEANSSPRPSPAEVDSLRARVRHLESDLRDAQAAVSAAGASSSAAVTRVQLELDQLVRAHDQTRDRLAHERVQAQEAADTHDRVLRELRADNRRLGEEIDVLRRAADATRARSESDANSLAQLRRELDHARQSHDATEAADTSANRTNDLHDQTAELIRLTRLRTERQQRALDEPSSSNSAAAVTHADDADIDSLAREELLTRYRTLRSAFDAHLAHAADLSQALTRSFAKEVSSLQAQVASLRRREADGADQDATPSTISSTTHAILLAEFHAVSSSYAALQDSYARIRVARDAAVARVSSAKSLVLALNAERKDLLAYRRRKREECERLRGEARQYYQAYLNMARLHQHASAASPFAPHPSHTLPPPTDASFASPSPNTRIAREIDEQAGLFSPSVARALNGQTTQPPRHARRLSLLLAAPDDSQATHLQGVATPNKGPSVTLLPADSTSASASGYALRISTEIVVVRNLDLDPALFRHFTDASDPHDEDASASQLALTGAIERELHRLLDDFRLWQRQIERALGDGAAATKKSTPAILLSSLLTECRRVDAASLARQDAIIRMVGSTLRTTAEQRSSLEDEYEEDAVPAVITADLLGAASSQDSQFLLLSDLQMVCVGQHAN